MAHVTLRMADGDLAKLDELCRDRKESRSAVLRTLVQEEHGRLVAGKTSDACTPVDAAELTQLLSIQARKGNVTAMRELRAIVARGAGGRPPKSDEPDVPPEDAFEELDNGVVNIESRRRGAG